MVDHMQMSHRDILNIQGIESTAKSKKLSEKPDNILITLGIEFIDTREIIPKQSLLYKVNVSKS